jgi:tetratricopeptide (TPR) repeat protein
MPYFGGTSLAALLGSLTSSEPGQRTAADIRAALGPVEPLTDELAGPSYVRAVCWIGVCLAEALQYAHERGLVHLDLKPSNVLLAADGTPMLLDFHLARAPIPAGGPAPDWLGGTPAYMAPEQRAAIAAVRTGTAVPAAVDGRADVYGLGLLLYEALGGSRPLRQPRRTLRRCNPQVSVGLADIVAKCLAAEPAARYATAADLAADLRRHLNDLPLRGVANRSLAERWAKWRRRWPFAPVLLALGVAILAAATFALAHFGQRLGKAHIVRAEGIELLRGHRYREAEDAFRRALDLTEDAPFQAELRRDLRNQLRLANRAQAAQELHRFVEQIRPLYGADGLGTAPLQQAEGHCRTFWHQRDRIMERLAGQPDQEQEQQVRTDFLDLTLLWTDMRVRLAGADATAHRQAVAVLDEAERLFGQSCVLDHERRDHAAALGQTVTISEVPPRTAWEHYALGRLFLRSGNLAVAQQHLDRAVDLQPQSVWPHFYHGQCAFQAGRHHDAVADFTACIALAHESGWCYHNRAMAYTELKLLDRAYNDYDRALALDPTLAPALLNRGLLHYRQQRYAEALVDLQHALDGGANPTTANFSLALVHRARGERTSAIDRVRRVLELDPRHQEAQRLQSELQREP